MGSAVPSRVSLLISIFRLNLMLTYGIPPEFIGSRNCVPMAHTVESLPAQPVNLKVVPNECYLGRSPWTN